MTTAIATTGPRSLEQMMQSVFVTGGQSDAALLQTMQRQMNHYNQQIEGIRQKMEERMGFVEQLQERLSQLGVLKGLITRTGPNNADLAGDKVGENAEQIKKAFHLPPGTVIPNPCSADALSRILGDNGINPSEFGFSGNTWIRTDDGKFVRPAAPVSTLKLETDTAKEDEIKSGLNRFNSENQMLLTQQQSLVNSKNADIQLCTSMLSADNDIRKTILSNIGR